MIVHKNLLFVKLVHYDVYVPLLSFKRYLVYKKISAKCLSNKIVSYFLSTLLRFMVIIPVQYWESFFLSIKIIGTLISHMLNIQPNLYNNNNGQNNNPNNQNNNPNNQSNNDDDDGINVAIILLAYLIIEYLWKNFGPSWNWQWGSCQEKKTIIVNDKDANKYNEQNSINTNNNNGEANKPVEINNNKKNKEINNHKESENLNAESDSHNLE